MYLLYSLSSNYKVFHFIILFIYFVVLKEAVRNKHLKRAKYYIFMKGKERKKELLLIDSLTDMNTFLGTERCTNSLSKLFCASSLVGSDCVLYSNTNCGKLCQPTTNGYKLKINSFSLKANIETSSCKRKVVK